MSEYHPSDMPGGSDPDSTTHCAELAYSATVRTSASISAGSTTAPGSLIFVVVPSVSVMARLVRTAPATGTAWTSTPIALSATRMGSWRAAGSTATTSRPANVRARATLTPLPPGSDDTEVTRCTAPRTSAVGRVTVRSMLGLGVTVMIMRQPGPQRDPHRGRSARRDPPV